MPLTKKPKFSLRNVTCDHYMVLPNASLDPTSSHDHRSVNRVPVIRVFGILDSGQKCCLHVHGVLPYIMLECQAEVDGAFADQFADALDTALNMAISQRPNANGRPTGPHVHRIKVVKGL
uniref:DNA-directed DNA polymerase family B exonuclease domain-containing protein n=1 Tax=Plectus sambesii TaxID=2011161 RepID=A0A914UTZ4_9BILA